MDVEPSQKDEVKSKSKDKAPLPGQMFVLKKWNAVAMWSWDVECDTCAICRVQVMGELLAVTLNVWLSHNEFHLEFRYHF